jgi:ribosome-associated protein
MVFFPVPLANLYAICDDGHKQTASILQFRHRGIMALIRVTSDIAIDESELDERFVLASGPGGQNVNKVATAVQLRFPLAATHALREDVRFRAMTLAGRRLTKDGVLVLEGNRFRSQERNRADVRERLFELLRKAAVVPATRHKTKPPKAAKRKRIDSKTTRGRLKRLRARPDVER